VGGRTLGYKNSLKGVGYFLGAALLEWSYEMALMVMILFIVVALPFAIFGLTTKLGRVVGRCSLKGLATRIRRARIRCWNGLTTVLKAPGVSA
jgi:hypothetical protein